MAKNSSKSRRDEEEYDNTNSGVLFSNGRKEKKSHPDMTGSFTDKDGIEYWLAGWFHKSREGKKFISLKATEKEEQPEEEEEEDEKPSKKSSKKSSKKDDDLPF